MQGYCSLLLEKKGDNQTKIFLLVQESEISEKKVKVKGQRTKKKSCFMLRSADQDMQK